VTTKGYLLPTSLRSWEFAGEHAQKLVALFDRDRGG
jgi:hypothetical protein